MNLVRTESGEQGIFSILTEDDGSITYFTLEHSYLVNGIYIPKIPMGVFTCVRGFHRLEGMTHDFETFEITGVEGHMNLLFHSGNFNSDSAGCILLGLARNDIEVLHSRDAFNKFMESKTKIDNFLLTVTQGAAS